MEQSVKTVLWFFVNFCWYVMMPIIVFGQLFDQPLFNGFLEHKSFIFITLAAICSAVCDCVENEHINVTIFDRLPEKFWSKRIGWNKVFVIFKYPVNAWHLFKSAMIVSFILFGLHYKDEKVVLGFWPDFLIFGAWYNHTFNGFYNYIFKK